MTEFEDTLEEAVSFYSDRYQEESRLNSVEGQLEFTRTKEILAKYLPPPGAHIVDVGGGPGVYATWLADLGYRVHLIDAVPLHVKQAQTLSQGRFLASLGDARSLTLEDDSADAVLLMGPLYHLTNGKDRLCALQEARRIARRGGIVFAAAISRFASAMNRMSKNLINDPTFMQVVEGDLRDGQHRNPTDNPAYFTTAYFHLPQELKSEVQEAGLLVQAQLAIEGPAWLLANLGEYWSDDLSKERLLRILRIMEAEPSLLGASAHILVVAAKP